MDNPLLYTVTNNDIDTLIDPKTLQTRITELAKDITRDYQNQDLLMVCILRGGVVFLTDLMRNIPIPHLIDFMAVSSYTDGRTKSEGRVRITMDLLTDIEDMNVLLVEDIVDTGYTLRQVLELLNSRSPRSLRVCTLLDKHERREVEVNIDYVGFQIPDKFVVGYGLDDQDGHWRNLPYIGVARK
ncbi:MAG: hypoxanthine phosphoribosyltransferase [Chloroflexi bacterium]|nr:hypoxanthine phosphoribosyltransferase [Chloroflexota bacterium]HCU79694.1 hypoxanthine phosphoribosyltransferase [Chloroflexota bacterium]|tara:strand:- start:2290 stop:2844 length:555 start_codon:yes stop_codon:yes gene_type:complete